MLCVFSKPVKFIFNPSGSRNWQILIRLCFPKLLLLRHDLARRRLPMPTPNTTTCSAFSEATLNPCVLRCLAMSCGSLWWKHRLEDAMEVAREDEWFCERRCEVLTGVQMSKRDSFCHSVDFRKTIDCQAPRARAAHRHHIGTSLHATRGTETTASGFTAEVQVTSSYQVFTEVPWFLELRQMCIMCILVQW